MITQYQKFFAWLKTSFGQTILNIENKELTDIWKDISGDDLLTLGDSIQQGLTAQAQYRHKILVSPDKDLQDYGDVICADFESLPIEASSVDAVLLPHTLEIAQDAYQVLRGLDRVLSPEGYVIIIGFNPVSLFGLRRLLSFRNHAPWAGTFRCAWRIKDWLRLLNFEIIQQKKFLFRPPIQHEKFFTQLSFLEKIGRVCWPFFGGAYIILARKQEMGMTPIRLQWKKKFAHAVNHGIAKPATRGMQINYEEKN